MHSCLLCEKMFKNSVFKFFLINRPSKGSKTATMRPFSTMPRENKLQISLTSDHITEILASLASFDQKLFQKTSFILFKNPSDFTGLQLTKILGGISKPGLVDDQLMMRLISSLSLAGFSDKDMAVLVKILSTSRIYYHDLFVKILDKITSSIDIESAVTLLEGFTNLYATDLQTLVAKLTPSLLENINSLNTNQFITTLWSLSVSNTHLSSTETTLLINQAISFQNLTQSDLSKIYFWHLHATIPSTLNSRQKWIRLIMKARGSLDICDVCSTTHNILKLQDEVGSLLTGFERDGICPSTGFHIDFINPSTKTAIECLGTSHFVKDAGKFRECGGTMLRRRLLEKAGWRVVVVPYHKWSRKQRKERGEYLNTLLTN